MYFDRIITLYMSILLLLLLCSTTPHKRRAIRVCAKRVSVTYSETFL